MACESKGKRYPKSIISKISFMATTEPVEVGHLFLKQKFPWHLDKSDPTLLKDGCPVK